MLYPNLHYAQGYSHFGTPKNNNFFHFLFVVSLSRNTFLAIKFPRYFTLKLNLSLIKCSS